MEGGMDRRTLLQLFGGIAVAGARPFAFQGGSRNRIVIAGGGILGANIAYQLARRGASVTLLEKAKPGTGATANSFAWINAKKQPLPYFSLSLMGIEAWRELQADIGAELPVRWGGSLEWTNTPERAARQADTMRRFQAWGYPVHLIDEKQLRALEPKIVPGVVTSAAHSEIEGSADPVGATEVILARAAKAGAKIVYPSEVVGLDQPNGRLRAVKTSQGDVEADVLVIACGTDTPKLAALAGLNVQLTGSRVILFHTPPQPPTIDRILLSPIGNVKQKPDGRIVTGLDFGPAPAEDATKEKGEAFLKKMAAVLPQLEKAPIEKVTLGFRPLPKDSHPIVGFPEGRRDIYITVMHSGITLGPLIGRLASMEILDGVQVDPLAPYRLERFKT
jgi:glycine/D-amino acid oxidase-like deaminating enzyme